MTEFGDWLLQQLEGRNLSQTDLAHLIGITPAQVSRIVSGDRRASNETLEKISYALKLPIELVLRADGRFRLPKQNEIEKIIAEIEHIMEQLPPEEQEDIIEYARLRQRIMEERGMYEASKKSKSRHATSGT